MKKYFFLISLLVAGAVLLLIIFFMIKGVQLPVLNPHGIIAKGEKNIIVTSTLIMLVAVIPTYAFTFFVTTAYAADKQSTDVHPASPASKKIVTALLWAIPSIIILCIGVLTWKGAHTLDPAKKINSNIKPLTIQVVALEWKWLFLYPEQNIATVNFIEIPKDTPVHFQLTADAPMNSFWIPELSGQIYTMAGMVTNLHVVADKEGTFAGSAAEINGRGFSGMQFQVQSVSKNIFDSWVGSIQKSGTRLSQTEYSKLAEPSENNPKTFFSSYDKNVYNNIVTKFNPPAPANQIGGM